MRLLIIRHAIAEEREGWAPQPDTLRPLTERGRRRMRRGARGLRRLVPTLDALLSSPLTRAMQTAELVSDTYDASDYRTVPELAPGTEHDALLALLRTLPADATVALVGHEPDLSQLAGWLLCGQPRSLIELKKGAACLLELGQQPTPGGARLLWALTPAQLRRLRRG